MKSKIKLVIDSSVFISSLGVDDVYTKESRAFFKRISLGFEIYLPSVVLAEVLVILRKQGIKSVELFDHLSVFNSIPLDKAFLASATKFLRGKILLKTADFVIASAAKLVGATLVTWDKELLDGRKNNICLTRSPSQV